MKKLRHAILFGLIKTLYMGFRLLPFRYASAIGSGLGYVASFVGGRAKAQDNLRHAFKDISDEEISQIITKMYINFGRTMAEFTHMDLITPHTPGLKIDLEGVEILKNLQDQGQGALLFTGHYGNWELGTPVTAWHDLKVTPIFKESTNQYLNRFLWKMRQRTADGVIAVGPRAGYEILRHLKKGKQLVLLTDQRMSKGIRVPFFSRPAKTGAGIAKLALAAQCPLVPVMIQRVERTHFRLHIFPPLAYDTQAPDLEYEVLLRMNQVFEQWIRERPDNWWWEYHRWA
jgi:Kdo2-lipid IVA lauroyltransferase/acyltransferase